MSTRAVLPACAIFLVGVSAAAAQRWEAPPPAGARLGFQAIVCRGEFCLAVSCRGGVAELASMAPGGGPFLGEVESTIGAAKARLTFVEDPALMKAYNMAGTRAPAPAEMLAAMAGAKQMQLSGPTFSDRVTRRFSLAGYARFADKIAAACGLGE